jgi:hypothetical protein
MPRFRGVLAVEVCGYRTRDWADLGRLEPGWSFISFGYFAGSVWGIDGRLIFRDASSRSGFAELRKTKSEARIFLGPPFSMPRQRLLPRRPNLDREIRGLLGRSGNRRLVPIDGILSFQSPLPTFRVRPPPPSPRSTKCENSPARADRRLCNAAYGGQTPAMNTSSSISPSRQGSPAQALLRHVRPCHIGTQS